jgi:hypothetical protein
MKTGLPALHIVAFIAWIQSLLISSNVFAQPVLSSKINVHGFEVYQDHVQKNVFYYSPPEVRLKTNSSGDPAFLLLEMRYTGTHLYSDQDAKGFHNLFQMTVVLDPVSSEAYDLIRQTIGMTKELRPLPIRRFFGELIIPLGDAAAANEKYRKVSMGGVEASGAVTAGNSFWQERTFTMQLDNYEAQLLWDQVESGKLGVSFSYSFYAEAIPGQIGKVDAIGSSEDITEDLEDVPDEAVFDDRINTYLIKANTFAITIPSAALPNCLKRVDVNEELPPAYASFEVRCYDFSDDLRPDLFKKIVEIKAFAAAKEFITIKADFSRNARDIHSITSRFPYAIRLDQPMEYRVIEINVNGEKTTSPWIRRDNWSEVIDVTTPGKTNSIGKKSLDVELDLEQLRQQGYTEVLCELKYQLNGIEIHQVLRWQEDDEQPLKNILIQYDLAQPIWYRISFKLDGEITSVSKYKPLDKLEDYLFLQGISD